MVARRVYHYRVDFEGRLFHDGSEITDPVAIRQLIARVRHDAHGRPYALCMGEWMMLEPEDVIHVIQDFEDPAAADDATRLVVRCQAGVRRRIDLTRLTIRELAYIYAPCAEGGLARFGRRAAMGLARDWMEPTSQGFAVRIGERRFPVQAIADEPPEHTKDAVAPAGKPEVGSPLSREEQP